MRRSDHLNLFFQTEDEGDKIHRNDRTTIKQRIVGLMLKSPDQIQKQVSPFLHSSVTRNYFSSCQVYLQFAQVMEN